MRANNADDVDSIKTFKTNGVTEDQANAYLNTPEGKEYLAQAQAGAPGVPPDKMYQYAQGQVMSGSSLPVNVDPTEPLYKVVPSGQPFSNTSPYYVTQDQLNTAMQSGNPLGNELGLPLKSHADSFDVYQINPGAGASPIYQSPIAPTSELGGAYNTASTATQSLVTNKTGWSDATKIGNVLETGGSPIK